MINVTPDGKGIVWLASYPKSGNTWLRVFLYHVLRLLQGQPRENEELNHLDRASGYEAAAVNLYAEFLGKRVELASFEEAARVRPLVQAAMASRLPTMTLLKTHNFMDSRLISPQATIGAIYLVRDPRDVVVSLAHHLAKTIDETVTLMETEGYGTPNRAHRVFEVFGTWSDHVRSWTSISSDAALLTIRYEDMIADTIRTFTKVTRHLRTKVSREIVTEAARLSSFDQLKAAEKTYRFRETSEYADHFFREGKVATWRDKLNPEQVARNRGRAREGNAALGLPPWLIQTLYPHPPLYPRLIRRHSAANQARSPRTTATGRISLKLNTGRAI